MKINKVFFYCGCLFAFSCQESRQAEPVVRETAPPTPVATTPVFQDPEVMEAVYQAVEALHQWYTAEGYLFIYAINSTPPLWVVERLPSYSGGAPEPTPDNMKAFNDKKMTEGYAAGIFSNDYIQLLHNRHDETRGEGLGALLTRHPLGGGLEGFLVTATERLGYRPSLDSEGWQPSMDREYSSEELRTLQLRRIVLTGPDTAEYTALGTEVALGLAEYEESFLVVTLKKQGETFKVDGVDIKDVGRQAVEDFLKHLGLSAP